VLTSPTLPKISSRSRVLFMGPGGLDLQQGNT
jgi:hypothetical protein